MREPYEKGLVIHSAPSITLCIARCMVKRKQGHGWAGLEGRLRDLHSRFGLVSAVSMPKDGRVYQRREFERNLREVPLPVHTL